MRTRVLNPPFTLFAGLMLLLAATGLSNRASAAPAADGPVVRQAYSAPGNIPVEVFSDPTVAHRPLMLVLAHGYNFSKINMVNIAEAVARAGYSAVTFDFAGHGENPNDLDPSDPFPQTTADLENVIEFARQTLHGTQLALLGHSMGANTVLPYAMKHPEFVATDFGAGLPRNLLLFVGTSEDEGVIEDYQNAMQSAQAPAVLPYQFIEGTARLGVMIPGATHTTILYSAQTAQTVVDWLNAALRGSTLQIQNEGKAACWLDLAVNSIRLISICA